MKLAYGGGTTVRPGAPGLRIRGALVASLLVAIASSAASGHVVMGTKSLHLRVAEAPVVLRGRVLDPSSVFVSADEKSRRSLVEIAVLEELKGSVDADVLRFAQDGHAVATYHAGDEALFFLSPIARSRELRALAVEGGPSHVSSQEHDDEFLITPASRSILLSATRAFIASENAATTAERVELIRRATLELLTCGDDRLAASALASLVMAPEAAWITQADLPRLRATLNDPKTSIGFRAGLIAELSRRGLVSGEDERLALLYRAQPGELASAIRSVALHPSPRIIQFLLDQLSEGSTATSEVEAEAVMALGSSLDPRALPALARALGHDDARVRNAAIRGLGQMKSQEAEAVLREAASNHPDAGTRRRAQAAARMFGTRSEDAG